MLIVDLFAGSTQLRSGPAPRKDADTKLALAIGAVLTPDLNRT